MLPPKSNKNADQWQKAIWNMPNLSRAQRLQFMLMLEGQFNSFDPFRVVRDLLDCRLFWRGVIMGRGHLLPTTDRDRTHFVSDLISLRDIDEAWNANALFVITNKTEEEWAPILKHWHADEVETFDPKLAGQLLGQYPIPEGMRVFSVWWD